jgi:hypothetical protein
VEPGDSEKEETGLVGDGDGRVCDEDERNEEDEITEDALGIASTLEEKTPEDEDTGGKSVELAAGSRDAEGDSTS